VPSVVEFYATLLLVVLSAYVVLEVVFDVAFYVTLGQIVIVVQIGAGFGTIQGVSTTELRSPFKFVTSTIIGLDEFALNL